MKQTKILHTQEALIMGSIAQRADTVKMCYRLYKRTRKNVLMILSQNIIYHCNLR